MPLSCDGMPRVGCRPGPRVCAAIGQAVFPAAALCYASMGEKHANVIHESEVSFMDGGNGKRFAIKRKMLGRAAGGKKLGCSLYEQPPAAAAYPFHYHLANE